MAHLEAYQKQFVCAQKRCLFPNCSRVIFYGDQNSIRLSTQIVPMIIFGTYMCLMWSIYGTEKWKGSTFSSPTYILSLKMAKQLILPCHISKDAICKNVKFSKRELLTDQKQGKMQCTCSKWAVDMFKCTFGVYRHYNATIFTLR